MKKFLAAVSVTAIAFTAMTSAALAAGPAVGALKLPDGAAVIVKRDGQFFTAGNGSQISEGDTVYSNNDALVIDFRTGYTCPDLTLTSGTEVTIGKGCAAGAAFADGANPYAAAGTVGSPPVIGGLIVGTIGVLAIAQDSDKKPTSP
jgi:hypothetical protein